MIELHNDDCLKVMKSMDDGCIDLIVTDPPYYSTNLAFDKEPRIDFEYWLKECQRVLKPTGVLVSFADFNLLADLRAKSPFKSTYELIWHKTMAVGFLDANLRPLRAHEFIGVFTDAFKASTYNPQKTKGEAYYKTQAKTPSGHYRGNREQTKTNNTGDRHPTTIIQASNGNFNSLHPTQKPLDLVQWLIKTYSNENELVLDCFMGSGTTGAACEPLNRNFIGIEKDPVYFEMAKKRIHKTTPDLLRMVG